MADHQQEEQQREQQQVEDSSIIQPDEVSPRGQNPSISTGQFADRPWRDSDGRTRVSTTMRWVFSGV
jgi:hypothetical protein